MSLQITQLARLSATLTITLILTACASSGGGNISKIPAQTGDVTSTDGAFTQPLKWEKTKADCKESAQNLAWTAWCFRVMRNLAFLSTLRWPL